MVEDQGYVYMIVNNDKRSDDTGCIEYWVWPAKEYADMFANGEEIKQMEADEFVDWCLNLDNVHHSRFVFFPNGNDSITVSVSKLLNDLSEELERI